MHGIATVHADSASPRDPLQSTQPVPVSLPPVVLVGFMWVGGDVGRPDTSLAPLLPLWTACELEGAYILQRLVERQELFVFGGNVAGAQPVPIASPPVVLVGLIWVGGDAGRPGTSPGPVLSFCLAF